MFGGDYLSFEALQRNNEALIAWRDQNHLIAALVYRFYAATALSFPGGLALTLTGSCSKTGSAALLGASVGAIAIHDFQGGLAETLRARAGPFLKRAEEGFQENQVSWLLIMRLVPAVPFFIANILPAFLGARTSTYAWTTFLGIIPGGMVYASVGAGLGAVFAAGESPDLGVIFEPFVLGPLLGLAALSAIPMLLKRFRAKKG